MHGGAVGKFWPGSAALGNAFIYGAEGKKFQEAAVSPVSIFQIFPYMENLDFRYMENFIFYTTTEQN